MSDNNDFLGSSLQNYDTTENRMSPSSSYAGNGKSEIGGGKKHLEAFGHPVSASRAAAGTAALILCEVIAVASKVDGSYGLASMLALIAGFASAALIWFAKAKNK